MPTTISKKIIYKGTLPSGTIEPGTGEPSLPFEKDKPLEVPAKLADELLQREDWEEAQ
jgi:hypothetical protein